jgi:hypothetical protein
MNMTLMSREDALQESAFRSSGITLQNHATVVPSVLRNVLPELLHSNLMKYILLILINALNAISADKCAP